MLLILDCNFLAHRAKFAMKNVELSYERQKTEVIFNFMQQIYQLAITFRPRVWAFIWDSKKNFRKKIYPEYKAGRAKSEKTPEDIALDKVAYPQFTRLRTEVLPGLGFKNIFVQFGYEGDDVIASVVMGYNKKFGGATMVASDEDLFQLLSYANMYNPITKVTTTAKSFTEKWGITPKEWGRVKAIAGCGGGKNQSGDNVNGIEGVGNKTAAKYINETLKETTKAYKEIKSDEGQKIIERNEPVVVLPFKGTAEFELVKHPLYSQDFLAMWDKLGFQLYNKPDVFKGWVKEFRLK